MKISEKTDQKQDQIFYQHSCLLFKNISVYFTIVLVVFLVRYRCYLWHIIQSFCKHFNTVCKNPLEGAKIHVLNLLFSLVLVYTSKINIHRDHILYVEAHFIQKHTAAGTKVRK